MSGHSEYPNIANLAPDVGRDYAFLLLKRTHSQLLILDACFVV